MLMLGMFFSITNNDRSLPLKAFKNYVSNVSSSSEPFIIRFDEGLTLETSAFLLSISGSNLTLTK